MLEWWSSTTFFDGFEAFVPESVQFVNGTLLDAALVDDTLSATTSTA